MCPSILRIRLSQSRRVETDEEQNLKSSKQPNLYQNGVLLDVALREMGVRLGARNIQRLKSAAAAAKAKWRRVGVGVLRGSIAQGTGAEPHYTESTGSM
jgi:hypothetical protein